MAPVHRYFCRRGVIARSAAV